MIIFTLEILECFLLFRFVLGCEFQTKRSLICLGFALIVADYILRAMFAENMPIGMEWLFAFVCITSPIYFFRGRIASLLGVELIEYSIAILCCDLFYGIAIIAVDGRLDYVNPLLVSIISHIFCIVIIGIGGVWVNWKSEGDKKKRIWDILEKANPAVCLSLVILLYIVRLDSGYSGMLDQYAVTVIRGLNMTKNSIIGMCITIVCVLSFLLVIKQRELKRSLALNEKCIQEQTRQYAMLGNRDKELRKFRHDYNRHISVLQDMATHKHYEQMAAYVIQLGEMHTQFTFISTDNMICDAILNQYYGQCRAQGITFSVIGEMSPDVNIKETELCVILSNGMENAYEATMAYTGERMIQVRFRSEGSLAIIEICNSTKEKPVIRNGIIETTKADKTHHGFGTRNMKDTAEKNGGTVFWKFDEDTEIMMTRIILLSRENKYLKNRTIQ